MKKQTRHAVWIFPWDVLWSEDLWVIDLLNAGYGIMDATLRNHWIDRVLREYNRVDKNPYFHVVPVGEERFLTLEYLEETSIGKDTFTKSVQYLYCRIDWDVGKRILIEICLEYPELWKKYPPKIYNKNGIPLEKDWNVFFVIDKDYFYDMSWVLKTLFRVAPQKCISLEEIPTWCRQYIQEEDHLEITTVSYDIWIDHWFVENYEESFTEDEKEKIEMKLKIVMDNLGNRMLAQEMDVLDIPTVSIGILKLWDSGILNVHLQRMS